MRELERGLPVLDVETLAKPAMSALHRTVGVERVERCEEATRVARERRATGRPVLIVRQRGRRDANLSERRPAHLTRGPVHRSDDAARLTYARLHGGMTDDCEPFRSSVSLLGWSSSRWGKRRAAS